MKMASENWDFFLQLRPMLKLMRVFLSQKLRILNARAILPSRNDKNRLFVAFLRNVCQFSCYTCLGVYQKLFSNKQPKLARDSPWVEILNRKWNKISGKRNEEAKLSANKDFIISHGPSQWLAQTNQVLFKGWSVSKSPRQEITRRLEINLVKVVSTLKILAIL